MTTLVTLGEIPAWLGVLAAITTVAALIAGTIAALLMGSLGTVRADNGDLRAGRADDKEKLAEKDAIIQRQLTDLAERDGQIGILKEINSGIVNWTAVTDQVAHHHERAETRWNLEDGRWNEQTTLLEQIRDRLPEGP